MAAREEQSLQHDVWTVQRVLQWTTGHLQSKGCETPRLDSEILLAHVCRCERIHLYTDFHRELNADQRARMRELIHRRSSGEPVAYLVGHREFYSLDFIVTPDVLIPRPETETLVLELEDIAKPFSKPEILDLCTGSGCIAVATARQLPEANVTATDLSEPALAIAKQNAVQHQLQSRIQFFHGDLFAALPGRKLFDCIVSNPPYVAAQEMASLPVDVRDYEPKSALVAGPDGLSVITRIVQQSTEYLKGGGWLLLEFSPEQAIPICRIFCDTGIFREPVIVNDLTNRPRVVKAQHV